MTTPPEVRRERIDALRLGNFVIDGIPFGSIDSGFVLTIPLRACENRMGRGTTRFEKGTLVASLTTSRVGYLTQRVGFYSRWNGDGSHNGSRLEQELG